MKTPIQEPSVDYLKEIARIGIERSKDYPDESFRIRGLWRTDLLFKPNPAERTFDYTFLLVQTFGEGACYCSTIPALKKGQYLLGQDCREVKHEYRCFEVATTDAMFSAFERHPDERYCETGSSRKKALWRSDIVVTEVMRQLEELDRPSGRVVNVGVIGNIVKMLSDRGVHVVGTDEDPAIVGTEIDGVPVFNEDRTLELIEESDVAVMTGMIISTDTMDDIIKIAKRAGTRIVLFCETGANLCEEYVKMGIDTAIAEPFPFYIFGGTSRIDVYRKR